MPACLCLSEAPARARAKLHGAAAELMQSMQACCNVADIRSISSLVEASLMGVVSNLASTHLSAAALKVT